MSDFATVPTTHGVLKGRTENSITSFLGVPYAQPPTGPLRFKAPRAVHTWDGTRDALQWANKAVQPLKPKTTETVQGDEDCLYLNIWTPDTKGHYPIVFFAHGGAFVMGSANDYDGTSLASSGLVVVTVGYRIGAFGYLYLEELAPGVTDSNLALRDLTMALEWVADNAHSFGGDPDNIILAGRSSGAMTVGALLAAPRASGLFSGAWLMSGAARQVRTPEAATRSAEMFLDAVGLDAGNAGDLLGLSSSDIARGTGFLIASADHDEAFDAEVMLPVVGDDFLPRHPLESISRGACQGKTLVVSWTAKDMAFFQQRDPDRGVLNKELYAKRLFGQDWWMRMEDIYQRTGDDPYIDLLTDFHFALPAIRLAGAAYKTAKSVRICRFDETPITPPWPDLGPVHTCDAFYLFTPLTPPVAPTAFGVGTGMLAADQELALRIRKIFLAMGTVTDFDEIWEPYAGQNRALSLSASWDLTTAIEPERYEAWGDMTW